MTRKDDTTEQYISSAPTSTQNALRKALAGTASPRAAIKAKCLTCCDFERDEVENCTVITCPLHSYRPYQPKNRRKQDKNAPEEQNTATT